jgi:hypothetical protein
MLRGISRLLIMSVVAGSVLIPLASKADGTCVADCLVQQVEQLTAPERNEVLTVLDNLPDSQRQEILTFLALTEQQVHNRTLSFDEGLAAANDFLASNGGAGGVASSCTADMKAVLTCLSAIATILWVIFH